MFKGELTRVQLCFSKSLFSTGSEKPRNQVQCQEPEHFALPDKKRPDKRDSTSYFGQGTSTFTTMILVTSSGKSSSSPQMIFMCAKATGANSQDLTSN